MLTGAPSRVACACLFGTWSARCRALFVSWEGQQHATNPQCMELGATIHGDTVARRCLKFGLTFKAQISYSVVEFEFWGFEGEVIRQVVVFMVSVELCLRLAGCAGFLWLQQGSQRKAPFSLGRMCSRTAAHYVRQQQPRKRHRTLVQHCASWKESGWCSVTPLLAAAH